MKLGQAIADNAPELAALEARDTGKPLKQGAADMIAAARYFEFYGAAADKLHGDTMPFLNGYTVAIVRDPHGVTGHIIPWNYPAQIFGRSVGASLACGNACVVKPAEDACLSVVRFAELAREAGFPDGALNVVAGSRRGGGRGSVGHPGIDFISFTGSRETGAAIQAAAARNNIGCTMELGGKSPQIVFADADIEAARPRRRQRDHPERRPDLFGRLARADRALELYDRFVATRRALCQSARRPAGRWTSTWAR